MADPFWLSAAQTARLERCFPKPYGKPRVHCPAVIEIIVGSLWDGRRVAIALAALGICLSVPSQIYASSFPADAASVKSPDSPAR